MQDYPLTLDKFIDHAAKWHGGKTIATAVRGQVVDRAGYADVRARSNRLSGALRALGLATGDRVGTLAWNSRHHLEMHYATMNAGLADPTLKRRLAELGCLVYPGTPAAMAAFVAREIDKWAKVIRTAGIKPE